MGHYGNPSSSGILNDLFLEIAILSKFPVLRSRAWLLSDVHWRRPTQDRIRRYVLRLYPQGDLFGRERYLGHSKEAMNCRG